MHSARILLVPVFLIGGLMELASAQHQYILGIIYGSTHDYGIQTHQPIKTRSPRCCTIPVGSRTDPSPV